MIAMAVPGSRSKGEAAPVQRLANRGRSASGGCISRCALAKSSQGQAWHTTHGKVTVIAEILQRRVKPALSGHNGRATAISTDLNERAQKTRKTGSQIGGKRRFDN